MSDGGRGPDDVSVLNGGRFAAGRGQVDASGIIGAAGADGRVRAGAGAGYS